MASGAQGRGRRNLTIILVAVGVLATWIGIRVRQHGGANQVSYLAGGLLFFVLSIGVGLAHNWARVACGIVSLVMSAGELVVMIPGVHTSLGARSKLLTVRVVLMIVAGAWLLIGLYCLRPATKRAFAEARDAIARGRIKPV